MSAAPMKAEPVVFGKTSNNTLAMRSVQSTVLQVADRINDALTLVTPKLEDGPPHPP